MVELGFLQNPEVRRWLNGVEPAWTMLEFTSLNALRHEPSGSNHAIRLEPDLADADLRSRPIRYSCCDEQPRPISSAALPPSEIGVQFYAVSLPARGNAGHPPARRPFSVLP